jgi:hypothetical protein
MSELTGERLAIRAYNGAHLQRNLVSAFAMRSPGRRMSVWPSARSPALRRQRSHLSEPASRSGGLSIVLNLDTVPDPNRLAPKHFFQDLPRFMDGTLQDLLHWLGRFRPRGFRTFSGIHYCDRVYLSGMDSLPAVLVLTLVIFCVLVGGMWFVVNYY